MDANTLIKLTRQWGRQKGITGELGCGTQAGQYRKLVEEVGELGQALIANDSVETIDAIGDIAVVLILLADMKGLKLEYCLESAFDVIQHRKGRMVNGVFVKEGGAD